MWHISCTCICTVQYVLYVGRRLVREGTPPVFVFLLSLRFEDANPAGWARHKTAGEAVKRSKATSKSDLWWSY